MKTSRESAIEDGAVRLTGEAFSVGPAVRIAEILVIAVLYALLGRLGQIAAIPPGHITPVWPASGIALAAVLLRGNRVWPGIWLGSVLVNVWVSFEHGLSLSHAAILAAMTIGIGAVVEALLGATLLRRAVGRQNPFSSGRGVVRFVLLSAMLSCLVGATVGTTALSLAGSSPWGGYETAWSTWWLGDTTGILLVTPLILTWSRRPAISWRPARVIEAAFFVLAVVGAAWIGFWGHYPLAYLIIPVLVWAAFRFGQHGATAAILGISSLAIAGTVSAVGPFVGAHLSLNESLLLLQGFMAAIVLTSVALAAVITERQLATEELARHRDHLEEIVRERTALFSEKLEQLQASETRALQSEQRAVQANHVKSQFLASVSHELRTPLNAIIGYGELLEEEAVELGQGALVPDIKKVQTASRHLLALINDILDLAKIEAGKLELVPETFELPLLIQEVLGTIRPLAAKNGNAIDLHLEDGVGSIRADPIRVRQILLNLLSNACKFADSGTISFDVSRSNARGAGTLVIRIEDRGIGMTPAQMEHLFQAFTQAEASVARRFGGTGIGLVISRRLARLMGGDIAVTSETGKGTVVTLELPRGLP